MTRNVVIVYVVAFGVQAVRGGASLWQGATGILIAGMTVLIMPAISRYWWWRRMILATGAILLPIILMQNGKWSATLIGGLGLALVSGWPLLRNPRVFAGPRDRPRTSRLIDHPRLRVALLGLLIAVVSTGGLIAQHRAEQQRQEANNAEASALSRARLLPRSPAAAGAAVLRSVVHTDATACTTIFSEPAAQQLAHVVGAKDCPTAIGILAREVTDPSMYPEPDSGSIVTTSHGTTATVDECHMTWAGLRRFTGSTQPLWTPAGPQVAQLELTQVLGEGWSITAVHTC